MTSRMKSRPKDTLVLGEDPTWYLPQSTTKEALEEIKLRKCEPKGKKHYIVNEDNFSKFDPLQRYCAEVLERHRPESHKATTYLAEYKTAFMPVPKMWMPPVTIKDQLIDAGVFRKCKSYLADNADYHHTGIRTWQDEVLQSPNQSMKALAYCSRNPILTKSPDCPNSVRY